MARIDEFILGPNLINLAELCHDVLRKILEEHVGYENGIPHRELCHYYFDPYPIRIEDRILITNMLQGARWMMQEGDWFLDYRRGRWFAVVTAEEAFDHVRRRAKREVKLHYRTQVAAHIATGAHYQLPVSNPLIQAIHGMTPAIEQLEEAVNNPEPPAPPQLEEGQGEED